MFGCWCGLFIEKNMVRACNLAQGDAISLDLDNAVLKSKHL